MEKLGLNQLREMYLAHFEKYESYRLKSFSLVPHNDKSLLLINSGMAPMKTYFTGMEVPPAPRVTTCQKCIRTGDIENVGITARHGTFFEMLGNFSFGNYFKNEAIAWAWEFVTKELKLPVDRVHVSVYEEDLETEKIWNEVIGVPMDHIHRLGKDDNFWEVGVGPCGPCTELYYDRGEEFGCGEDSCTVGCDCDRFMEFWNLVFTQFEKTESGEYLELEQKNIDTGMGLERIASIMQGVNTIFDIDTLKAVRDKICSIAKYEYTSDKTLDISVRVITDHIRSVTFMASDGILPTNEGRGYVMRRLARRAIIHGKKLGINEVFLKDIAQVVIEQSCDAYPELKEKSEHIIKVLTEEEKRFYNTLDQGLEILEGFIAEIKENGQDTLAAENTFKMYDTFGFPIDLMIEILEEKGLKVDLEGFKAELEKQRQRARDARKESTYMGADSTVFDNLDVDKTKFVGYEDNNIDTEILEIIIDNEIVDHAEEGETVAVIIKVTPMYAEGGGQKGDIGLITTSTGEIKVTDVKKVVGDRIIHIGEVVSGEVEHGQSCLASFDIANRNSTAKNHTATHILQKALRQVLGNHVEQSGSYVTNERLRFDFSHSSAMTADEIDKVEQIVNKQIMESLEVEISNTSIEEARQMGAMALFGEKYGNVVRVVNVNGFSIELCGGTHVRNSAEIGIFKIVSEGGVAAGVRRIEALTSINALNYFKEQENTLNIIADSVKSTKDVLVQKVISVVEENKALQNKVRDLESKIALSSTGDLTKEAFEHNGAKVIVAKIENMDGNGLKTIGDQMKNELKSCVIALVGVKDDKISVVAMATDDLIEKGAHAGNLVKEIATTLGGGGGGRPNMAQAGGKDITKVDEAIENGIKAVKSMF